MGGGGDIGEESDNPVEINATAMIDVTLCLCAFFMCSFHFKQLEGKVDAWLPKVCCRYPGGTVCYPILAEVRIFMKWDADLRSTVRKVGNRGAVSSDAELLEIVRQYRTDFGKVGMTRFPVIIDATETVPWQDVVRIIDLCKVEGLPIEFPEPIHQ